VREPELSLDVVSLGTSYDVRAEKRIVVELADPGLRGG
jgi:metal-sulfur cluster biosynthetic enzyme